MVYSVLEIGERIKKERKKLGLSQEEFASRIFCSRQSLIEWEKGRNLPQLDLLLRMSEVFECELAYLLCEIDCKTRENADISNALGLSDNAINELRKINNINQWYIKQALEKILTNDFSRILDFIGMYLLSEDRPIKLEDNSYILSSSLQITNIQEELTKLRFVLKESQEEGTQNGNLNKKR